MGTWAGHMCDPSVAAFDPIFWLHHCNVDRQAAMFQTLNSTLWFDQPESDDPSPKDPLEPFHYDTQSSTYNSDMVRDWTRFNYTYDGLPQPVTRSGDAQPAMILAAQSQIASTSPSTNISHHSTLNRAINGQYGNTRKDLLHAPEIQGRKNDYIINIVYDR
jgi:tyrosinase